MDKFVTVLFNTLLFVANFFLMIFMMSTLWGWFIVPLGAPVIGMAHAFGLSLIVTYFQNRHPKLLKSEFMLKRTLGQRFGFNIGIALSALLIGYITQLFM